MVALVCLPYPIATFFTVNKAQIRPRMPVIQCSIHVSLSLSPRRSRRRNYLRPKILKTLTKPYPNPNPDSTLEGLGTCVEPNVVVPIEKSGSGVVEELETFVGVNGGGLQEVEVVRDNTEVNVMGFKGFNGWTVFKVVASFVGLFVLQTVVSVWIMESGDSGEKDRRVGIEGRHGKEAGSNGSVIAVDTGLPSVDELKIAEIKRMAREVREAEKKKRDMKKGEADVEDESDDEEDYETDDSLKNDVGKEIDGRLTVLRKNSSIPVKNVNFIKRVVGYGKEVKNENVNGKEDDNRLMFEAKRKFRSHMSDLGDKPKGFEGNDDVREKGKNVNGAKSKSGNIGMGKLEEKPLSHNSIPSQGFKKSSESEEENLRKGINGSSNLGSDSISNEISKVAKPESEPQRKMNDQNVSTSKMDPVPRNGKSDSGKLKSNLSRNTNKYKTNNDDRDLWWSTLPCAFVILTQRGRGSDVDQRFYNLRINSDVYTVAFEDQNDARNFSYILDSFFEDLPDTAVDYDLISTKDLKEMIELENEKVVVVRKGKLKLYAGQPLADAESALRSLVK